MRILLIYPCAEREPTLWMPLGLALIAAELRHSGHIVAIFDRHAAQFKLNFERRRVNAAMLEQFAQY